MHKRLYTFITVLLLFYNVACSADTSFQSLRREFITGYNALPLHSYTYDYREYFSAIPSLQVIRDQQAFFNTIDKKVSEIRLGRLAQKERIDLEVIKYEIELNLNRLKLEEKWVQDGRHIPVNGLYSLPQHEEWYKYFILKFTTTNITPEEVFDMGKAEVLRVKNEISTIRQKLGYTGNSTFYQHLGDESFFLTNKEEIIQRFTQADSIVRRNLPLFIDVDSIPSVYPIEWPGAGPATPPGIYLNSRNNAYGKDVFMFNFYGERFNYRVLEWLYMHEAIPGHHLQSSLRIRDPLLDMFLYPGNFEGWGCYVEYYGKELGLYADPYMELGKWEWDLVRSVRLVLDAGIHHYGWSKEDAMAYWKENIQGQDDIAKREIDRVTNWPAQALSYKVGAAAIFRMEEEWTQKGIAYTKQDFRKKYLMAGTIPLAIMQQFINNNENE